MTESEEAPPIQTQDNTGLPTNQFTIQATVFLKSLYPDATVRTIVSYWDSSTSHPGWALGVTSTKSAHQPRNLILQFVGKNESGQRHYEVVPSAIHLELNRPYTVTAAVDLTKPGEDGVLFVVEDLTNKEVQTARIPHKVIQHEENSDPLILGGRSRQQRHRWDGWLDQVTLWNTALTQEQIQNTDVTIPIENIVGRWSFDDVKHPTQDEVHGRTLVVQGKADEPSPLLVDLCHVLLNSNEFIYID